MTIAASTDVPTVLVELGGLLLALAVVGRLAGRIGISPISLYVAVGLLVGEGSPIALESSLPFVETGANIGIVVLLLVLGLEYSGRELIANLHANRAAGALDLVTNFTPGLVAAWLLGWSTTAALFLGGITYVSSSGIVSKLLADLGRIGNRETPAVLSILIIEDLAMSVYLPVVASLLVATGILDTLVDIGIAGLAVAVAFAITLRFGDRLSRLVFVRSPEMLLLSVLGIALLVAGTAEQIHAPAAVGALLVGIALSGPAADSAQVVLAPMRDLFAAVFFVFFGVGLDAATLLPALPTAALLALVGIAAKVGTGAWAAGRAGIGLPGRVRAGTVLVPRGEFSIIIAGLALAGGVEPDLGPLAAAYVLVLATAGPLLTRYAGPIAATAERVRARRHRSR